MKIILNNPNPTSSLWLLPAKDVHFDVSILTLLVYIFFEYIDNFRDQGLVVQRLDSAIHRINHYPVDKC